MNTETQSPAALNKTNRMQIELVKLGHHMTYWGTLMHLKPWDVLSFPVLFMSCSQKPGMKPKDEHLDFGPGASKYNMVSTLRSTGTRSCVEMQPYPRRITMINRLKPQYIAHTFTLATRWLPRGCRATDIRCFLWITRLATRCFPAYTVLLSFIRLWISTAALLDLVTLLVSSGLVSPRGPLGLGVPVLEMKLWMLCSGVF